MAIKLEKDARSVASRHDDDNLAYDQVWCVFDVDEHGNLPETRQMAQKNQIQVACSNPCFELWALLHFQDQKSYIERTVAKQRLRQHQPAYEKKLNCTVLHERCDAAVRRATWLEQQATRNGDPFGNPTSGVWKLVTELYAQGGITVDG